MSELGKVVLAAALGAVLGSTWMGTRPPPREAIRREITAALDARVDALDLARLCRTYRLWEQRAGQSVDGMREACP